MQFLDASTRFPRAFHVAIEVPQGEHERVDELGNRFPGGISQHSSPGLRQGHQAGSGPKLRPPSVEELALIAPDQKETKAGFVIRQDSGRVIGIFERPRIRIERLYGNPRALDIFESVASNAFRLLKSLQRERVALPAPVLGVLTPPRETLLEGVSYVSSHQPSHSFPVYHWLEVVHALAISNIAGSPLEGTRQTWFRSKGPDGRAGRLMLFPADAAQLRLIRSMNVGDFSAAAHQLPIPAQHWISQLGGRDQESDVFSASAYALDAIIATATNPKKRFPRQPLATAEELRSPDFLTWLGGKSATVAFVQTDIAGYTSLLVELGIEGMSKVMVEHVAALRAYIHELGGYELKLIGDAFLVAFKTAPDALDFALKAYSNTGHELIHIRAAIDVGIAQEQQGDALGVVIIRVTRIIGLVASAVSSVTVSR